MNKSITQKNIEHVVRVTRKGAMVHSTHIAKIFGKSHDNILKLVRKTEISLVNINESVSEYIKDSSYINSRGKLYPRYELSRKGFDLIVLSLTGDKALQYKVWFINEFHNKNNTIQSHKQLSKEHKELPYMQELRTAGKIIRKELTDAIVNYDVPLGVKVGKDEGYFTSMRMMNYTRLIYRLLSIKLPKGAEVRDVLGARDLVHLEDMELKAAELLKNHHTEEGITYQELYQRVREGLL